MKCSGSVSEQYVSSFPVILSLLWGFWKGEESHFPTITTSNNAKIELTEKMYTKGELISKVNKI